MWFWDTSKHISNFSIQTICRLSIVAWQSKDRKLIVIGSYLKMMVWITKFNGSISIQFAHWLSTVASSKHQCFKIEWREFSIFICFSHSLCFFLFYSISRRLSVATTWRGHRSLGNQSGTSWNVSTTALIVVMSHIDNDRLPIFYGNNNTITSPTTLHRFYNQYWLVIMGPI